ncbi:hypothetical protein RO3G_15669 [Rhizopus delemar RA 99-880]|uniref:Uncharacterized protein n=1 Tax=Rhizopus delemar (strain RA 99-880 / ATCC MYA-4621 / FGSC 9543 / NRRL 43880) TaxID=246409 RepID=I1CR78_RHIO9|nr:hypothetical protein RO3G_15669 [Rhizopus delemar RA 99-880]|eukprot:EIE90958.1 hypothetical protein RO3G_15669 [Rhizopus delemar RA 99-880]
MTNINYPSNTFPCNAAPDHGIAASMLDGLLYMSRVLYNGLNNKGKV